jgi:hypothetical protein
MKLNARRVGILVTFAVLTAATVSASAQDRLPADIFGAESVLTPDQQSTIDEYADTWVEQLHAEDDKQVAAARGKLIDPLGMGGTPVFTQGYCTAVSSRLAGIANPERPIIQLNIMIVAARLNKDDATAALIQKGLDDECPAVRYWAVKAVRSPEGSNPGDARVLSAANQQAILGQLNQLLDQEQSTEVLEQIFVAMVELRIPAATERVYEGLNRRVENHIGKPELPYAPECSGLRGLFQKLLQREAEGQVLDEPFRQIARASVRLMILLSQQAAASPLTSELEKDYLDMALLCDQVLRFVHTKFKSSVPAPGDINQFAKNWQEIQVKALQWRDILTKSPFNFTDADLSIAGG